jgi:hypothetical protein
MATFGTRLYSRFSNLWVTPSKHKTETGAPGASNNFGARDMVRMIIQRTPNQTSDLEDWIDENANILSSIDNNGNWTQSGVPSMKYCITQIALTAAQIAAMRAAPVSILPAPGAGVAIVPDWLTFQMKPGATQFTGGGLVTFIYHGTAINLHGASDGIPAATVNSASGTTNLLSPVQAVIQPPANTGVDITNATAAFATGNGAAVVTIGYFLYTLQ